MKIFFCALTVFFFNIIYSQDIKYIKKGDFPDGIYMTLEDVLNKKPSSTEELFYRCATKCDSTELPEKAFFYFKVKNKKVLYPLGISFKGEMYFQTYRKYTNRKDKGYDPDGYSRFCKVTSYGRFVYFEEDMKGIWSKALMINLNPYGSYIKGKTRGMVIDLDKKEINILRNCDDLNDFLKVNNLKEINCESDDMTLNDIRKLVEDINQPFN